MDKHQASSTKHQDESATPLKRQRQTIMLNESTNEAVLRKGIKRRTDIGDASPASAPITEEKE